MKVTITIPQNIIDVLTVRGWDDDEMKVLVKKYSEVLLRGGFGCEEFLKWVEDQHEDELGDLFREHQELEVGMQVKILSVYKSGSNNKVGDVGKIIEISGMSFRVGVEGRQQDGNWQSKSEIVKVD